MKEETYTDLRGRDYTLYGHNSISIDKALKFISRLLEHNIPLKSINVTDWACNEIQITLDIPYPKRKQRTYRRFSNFDFKNAIKFMESE